MGRPRKHPLPTTQGGFADPNALGIAPPRKRGPKTKIITKEQKLEKQREKDSRVWRCHICKILCTNSSNLRAHIRTHTNERPYKCHYVGCLKGFAQHSNLVAHLRIHTGEKPYKCKHCHMAFARSSHLTGHERTHTGVKPYVCGVCMERFSTSTHLRNHTKRHNVDSEFRCRVCDNKTFKRKSQLTEHMQVVHPHERPLGCDECTKTFSNKEEQSAHMAVHMEENRFVCGRCTLGFKDLESLDAHEPSCQEVIFAPYPLYFEDDEDTSFEALFKAQYPHLPDEQFLKEEPKEEPLGE